MLGRTNITTVKGGIIATDIASYDWSDAATLNVNCSFKKSFYANNILTAIALNGSVIYTKDGENWEEAGPNVGTEYDILDGIWDGNRFIFVGSHSTDTEGICNPLIIITEDFQNYEIMRECTVKGLESESCGKFHAILLNEDSTYTFIISTAEVGGTSPSRYESVHFACGELSALQCTCCILGSLNYDYAEITPKMALDNIEIETVKNTSFFLLYVKVFHKESSSSWSNIYDHILGMSENGKRFICLKENVKDGENTFNYIDTAANMYKIIECKDSLYYMTFTEKENKLVRIKSVSDVSGGNVVATEDWGFVDAIYFNRCELFINTHQMLVVNAGENIGDKTEENLIDITYDFSLIRIVKAFGKLYIFGTNGNILVSSDEIKNESATAVKAMSAAKALYDAKKYTDERCAELEEMIMNLEAVKNDSTEV